ncbi:unnamed protein product [Kuraishia capsulata CBS 1993]|uniref:Extradiol ring-cleavage dioxygenase class III enzyme subunit B domain-containing protein n=1 Tax=Kuraishia capsulata CBS 1993 TaxID=1382522 RepID=W6MLG6_9ASCO|nr:uncharacterized protein KUCA_T00002930001 [Kuraishia capsulata CBS 1993]CDK26953.1 unnamed protein product [Kuraishia capsulata CBS 1993]
MHWVCLSSIFICFMSFLLSRYYHLFSPKVLPQSSKAMSTAAQFAFRVQDSQTPVFFWSHGGPTFMYPEEEFGGDRGAFKKVKEIGKIIKEEIRPDFLIVVSAHWQSKGPDLVEVGYSSESLSSKSKKLSSEENELIYDFYGFPDHMYREQFHSVGSQELAQHISQTLGDGGLKSKVVKRGIDHGVWVPFKVAFTDSKSQDSGVYDVDFPLVQVSLTSSSNFDVHFKLGQLLAPYRKLNGLIVCSGMSVHNLRDIGLSMGYPGKVMPYAEPFNKVVSNIVSTGTRNTLLGKFEELETNPELKKLYAASHPTVEHFLPLVVGAGAALDDKGEVLYSNSAYSLGWGMFKWGK